MGLGYWIAGLMVRQRRSGKIKNGKNPLKKPLFHYSKIETETRTLDNSLWFYEIVEIPRPLVIESP